MHGEPAPINDLKGHNFSDMKRPSKREGEKDEERGRYYVGFLGLDC